MPGLRELVFGVLCKHPRAGDGPSARVGIHHATLKDQKLVGRVILNWPLSIEAWNPSFTVY
jgi:hypothetical protein